MLENPLFKVQPFIVPESNLFLMTRFRKTKHHRVLSDAVSAGVHAFGLEFVRADNPNLPGNELWTKVQFCMEGCHFGVAVFEDFDEPYFNPNVSLELGYMISLRRECLLLKEKRLRKLPADLVGYLYKEFDFRNVTPTVLGQVAEWLKSTGVRKRDHEKLIIFVSWGGQDRCAMAKAITNHLLEKETFTGVRVESRAAFHSTGARAAKTAIEVVQNGLEKNWLEAHRPRRAGVAFLFEADLILAADRTILNRLLTLFEDYPSSNSDRRIVRDEIQQKTHLISEFFGGTGDIEDPSPDHEDAASRRKYERCFDDLYDRITKGFSTLVTFLEKKSPAATKLRTVSFGKHHLIGTTEV